MSSVFHICKMCSLSGPCRGLFILEEKLNVFYLTQYYGVVTGVRLTWALRLALQLSSCVALGRSLSPSELLFLQLKTYNAYVYYYEQ